jgi:hypothetical protein
VTWLLLTGAGLVAETVVIVALARSVTARDDRDDALQVRPGPTSRVSGRHFGLRVLDDQGALAERRDGVREAIS